MGRGSGGETEGAKRLARAARKAEGFALAPASARPLAALRVGLAATLLVQGGVAARAALELHGRPSPAIIAAGLAYAIGLVALLVGYRTRMAAAVAWLAHLALVTGTPADQFAHVFLFYLIWMPSGDVLSLDRRLGRKSGAPTPMARLSLRVVQVHLCLAYAASGVEKVSGEQWRNGDAIGRALMLPDARRFELLSWLANHPSAAVAAGWAVLLVEIGYALMVWPKRTRRIWVGVTVARHLGVALLMGLGVLGAIMSVLTVGAFGVSAEPGARDRGKRRPPSGRGQGHPGQVVGQAPASTCTQEGEAPPGT
jgi:hypothetical protein